MITALIHQPELVILDEPFSGLDPVNVALLIDLVNQLNPGSPTPSRPTTTSQTE
ncbi:hypothetical protein [Limosilactobacillus fermentum]|uniref:hypothetical protein n=1 Tax=Limosilactobacillus fermentum TaxID=1613 RepID=UPI003F031207